MDPLSCRCSRPNHIRLATRSRPEPVIPAPAGPGPGCPAAMRLLRPDCSNHSQGAGMKAIGKLALLGVLGGLGAGCSEDSTGTELPNIVGTWHATSAVTLIEASPTPTVIMRVRSVTRSVPIIANLTY